MKKFLSILIISLILNVQAASILNLGNLGIRGFVSHVCELTATLSDTALPFSMTAEEVQPKSDMTLYAGLQIGTWSVFADYSHLEVGFTVEPLKLNDSEVNYYLQFAYPETYGSNATYKLFPVLSDGVEHVKNLGYLYYDSYISIPESPFYVMMVDTKATLDTSSYESGTYSSNVTIRLTAND